MNEMTRRMLSPVYQQITTFLGKLLEMTLTHIMRCMSNGSSGIKCSFCQSKMDPNIRQPVCLPGCGHSFCRLCLVKIYDLYEELKCPECKCQHHGLPPRELPVNFSLVSFLENNEMNRKLLLLTVLLLLCGSILVMVMLSGGYVSEGVSITQQMDISGKPSSPIINEVPRSLVLDTDKASQNFFDTLHGSRDPDRKNVHHKSHDDNYQNVLNNDHKKDIDQASDSMTESNLASTAYDINKIPTLQDVHIERHVSNNFNEKSNQDLHANDNDLKMSNSHTRNRNKKSHDVDISSYKRYNNQEVHDDRDNHLYLYNTRKQHQDSHNDDGNQRDSIDYEKILSLLDSYTEKSNNPDPNLDIKMKLRYSNDNNRDFMKNKEEISTEKEQNIHDSYFSKSKDDVNTMNSDSFKNRVGEDDVYLEDNSKEMSNVPYNIKDKGDNGHKEKRKNKAHCNYVKYGAAGVVGVGALVAAPLVLASAGFTTTGIAANSLAAYVYSTAAVANGGSIAAGGLLAGLQSAGATGLGWLSTTVLGTSAAGAGYKLADLIGCSEDE